MNSNPPTKLKRITPNQIRILIQFMEDNLEFALGKLTETRTRLRDTKLWTELVSHLNKDAMGAVKNTAKWEKCWQDIKRNTRFKVAAIRAYRSGNGSCRPTRLTDTDIRVARAIGILQEGATLLVPQESTGGMGGTQWMVDTAALTKTQNPNSEVAPITWIPPIAPYSGVYCTTHAVRRRAVQPVRVAPVPATTQAKSKQCAVPSSVPQIFHASGISYTGRTLPAFRRYRTPGRLALQNTGSIDAQTSSAGNSNKQTSSAGNSNAQTSSAVNSDAHASSAGNSNSTKGIKSMINMEVKNETMIAISEQLKRIADTSVKRAEISERKAVALEKIASYYS